mmetsp:Transcript_2059/g.4659  ORF Transcript_2059/g.4659 Transcript_2059/m.4659 type:complete len:203 (-) Transcript_2059:101-709(-)
MPLSILHQRTYCSHHLLTERRGLCSTRLHYPENLIPHQNARSTRALDGLVQRLNLPPVLHLPLLPLSKVALELLGCCRPPLLRKGPGFTRLLQLLLRPCKPPLHLLLPLTRSLQHLAHLPKLLLESDVALIVHLNILPQRLRLFDHPLVRPHPLPHLRLLLPRRHGHSILPLDPLLSHFILKPRNLSPKLFCLLLHIPPCAN